MRGTLSTAFAVLCFAGVVDARQWPSGNVSVTIDLFPHREETAEIRSRLFLEDRYEPTSNLRITLSGFAEGLVAGRDPAGPAVRTVVRDAVLRPLDANVELTLGKLDLLAGYARVVWGRLDELQPTDVINPLDVSRFFFEGRGEARLPVPLVRGRLSLRENAVVEAVYVPFFRRGVFDQLDESTSPFNLTPAPEDGVVCLAIGCPVLTRRERVTPARTWGKAQGGVRLSATARRIDWSITAYRGFEPFGVFVASPDAGESLLVREIYPRFTMFGGDFETVSGEWGLRGEIGFFSEDNFQSSQLRRIGGRSMDGGIGFDRRAGDYTISGTVLVHSEWYDSPLDPTSSETGRTDVSLIASADRTFARERYRLRGFGVYNASESSSFVRAIGIAALRDNVALEGSVGWFIGEGRDVIGRFSDTDFLYARLKYYF